MNILKNVIFVLLLPAIISCGSGPTSTSEMRSIFPKTNYISSESAKEVAMCITEKLENREYGDVKMHPTEEGYIIIVEMAGQIEFLADIKDEETGSSTNFYENSWKTKRYFDKKVLSCQ